MTGKPVPLPIKLERAVKRFWSKVDMSDPDGCWIWTASTFGYGYGRCHDGEQMTSAHRFMASSILGWSIKGKTVCHRCDNPPCVNPWHLYVGNTHTNQQDAVRRGRWSNGNIKKTHCKRGHEFTDSNTYVNPSGQRVCRTCHRSRQSEYVKRKKT